jgi:hypothetical protein
VAGCRNLALSNPGAITVGKVAVPVSAQPYAITTRENQVKEPGKKLAKAARKKKRTQARRSITPNSREYFRCRILFNKDLRKHEYVHWKDVGN